MTSDLWANLASKRYIEFYAHTGLKIWLGEAAYNAKLMQLVPIIEKRFDVKLKKNYPKERMEAYTKIGGTWHLDDSYTVFGRVVSGMQVVEKIAAVETAPGDRPVEPVYVTMVVEEIPKKRIMEYPDIYAVK